MTCVFTASAHTRRVSGTSRVVAGRFRLGELLGAGGSASVFAAVDDRTGLHLALKVLHPHLSERPAAREAFLAEARRAQPLRHRNIVGVIGVGVDREGEAPVAWIALERAAGSSLSQHVARVGALPPAHAVAVADGVLQALEAAHAIGLIHRDVSPSNVMIAPDASGAVTADGVRLLDFGLADAAGTAALGTDDLLSVDAQGRTGVIGNVNYMSPEQVRGMPVDARGDVYQVGALLHFALTAYPPFPRETTGQTLRAHLETPPPLPSVSNGDVPRGLDRLVVRAMLKDPDDRFPSAAAMRAALAELGIRPSSVDASSSVAERPSTGSGAANERDETSRTTDLSIPIPQPVEALDTTRVLGRTVVPPRREASVGVLAPPPRIARSGAGAWPAAVAAIVVFGVVVVLAFMSPPTDMSAGPSSTPSPTATAVAPDAQAEPEPDRVEPAVALAAVPVVAGLSVGEAMRALADAGFSVGEVVHVDSPYARDIVLDASPAPRSRLAAGSVVALTAASGWNVVPDIEGQSPEAAAAAVEAAGFSVAFATRPAPYGATPGSILGTAPGAGTGMAVGGTVTIIEAGPDEPRPALTPTPTPPRPTPTPTSQPESRT